MTNHIPSAQSLMHALSLLEIKIAKLEQQSFEQEKELHACEVLAQALRAEIDILREQNLAALSEIENRGIRLLAMQRSYENSMSWRVTKPLRWMSIRLRRPEAIVAIQTENYQQILPGSPLSQHDVAQDSSVSEGPTAQNSEGVHIQGAIIDRHDYAEWISRFDYVSSEQLTPLTDDVSEVCSRLRVSMLSVFAAPHFVTADMRGMQAVRDSLTRQHHANWEWIIVCGPAAFEGLKNWLASEDRIRLIISEDSLTVPGNALNAALEHASGEWVAWVDARVQLRAHALQTAVKHLQAHPEAHVLFADEDQKDEQGQRSSPSFRCEANLDLLLSLDYLGQLVLFKLEDLIDITGWNGTLRAGHRHDLLLRLSERWEAPSLAIAHVPHILSHRLPKPAKPDQSAEILLPCCIDAEGVPPDDRESVPAIVQAHLSRRGFKCEALPHPTLPGACRVRFTLPEPPPRVGIVIPTRDNVGVLSVCLESLLQQSTYPDLRVMVVDNGSVKPETLAYLEAMDDPRVQVLRDDAPFNFSRLINLGAQAVEGEILCLLNNDMQITQPDWLEEMVGWALQDGVAAVGARLWYGEGTLQHGGIVLGIQGVAGHAHKHLAKGEPGYLNRAVLHQTMSAVTGACMVVRRAVFDEVGGFDEALAVAYNDVDFCLRARRAGYRNVWTPHAEMIHHESVSRGFEDSPEKQARFQREAALMRERWADWLDHDPAYNPNLTLEYEDFGLAWPPRASVV
ncbi:glycosyltransferase family 2 protein [Hydrogenophaga sp.]|uniref:glycosyltransferase family 2 protein n=1 Tax=Hydrogenophaga sp. TaxID=1904254 RepID=UPI0027243ACF|nr:glycosyltransferase family 2 protein [Hydrogenophaga sp.]MDO8903929.1 glycosyltransferase family 2 protein [Hydrogenophaga sp.]